MSEPQATVIDATAGSPKVVAAPAEQPIPGTAPSPAPAPPAAPAKADKDPDWLPARLAQAQQAAVTKAFTGLGHSEAELKTIIAEHSQMRADSMTEAEKAQARISELEPLANQASHYQSLYAAQVDAKFAQLPEATQTAIDAAAKGNPELREAHMAVLGTVGVAPQAAAITPASPPPATTAPAAQPPPPTATPTKYSEWQAITNPVQRDLFFRAHSIEIDKSRPA